MASFGIGQPVRRVEDRRFLTGRARYVDDIDLPRQLHGALVLSMATGLQVGQMEPKVATAAFMGLREWQFRAPVYFGDTIRVKRTIGAKSEHKNPAQGFVVYEIEVLNQDDKVVHKGQWNMLIRRRAPVEAATT